MKYRITNIVNADVVIEDLSIRLSGKGKSIVIDAINANKSRDLIANRHLVKIDKIGEVTQVPIWPFIKEKPAQEPKDKLISQDDSVSQSDINEIKLMLSDILLKINSKPDVKTVVIEKLISSPTVSTIPETSDEPIFIPSKITPDQAEVAIKLKEDAITKNDLSQGVQALKRLKSKVK